MDPWLIRMVNHPNCRDPGKLYLSHCTVTHSTEEEWWTKRLPLSDLPWHTDPNPSCTEGRNAFFNGPPQNHSPELPLFHIKHKCCFLPPHYGNSFYRSRPRKASVLACWRLSTCLPVLTSSHFSQLLPLWFTAALCQSPLLSQSAIQPFGSVSHGSTLITELQLLSQNGFPVATPKVYKLLLL